MSDARGCTRLRRPRGERNGNFKHGRYTQETKQIRDMLRQNETRRGDAACDRVERLWCEEKALGAASTRQ
jgi:hypothetical protein